MKLAYLTSHPIQYQAPLFRLLSNMPGVEFEALFCHDHGVKPTFDTGFGREVKYDTPLLEGYRHRFLPNLAPRPSLAFTGQINPSVVRELSGARHDAVILHGYAAATNVLALLAPVPGRTRVLMRGESHLLEERGVAVRAAKQVVLRLLLSRVDHFLAVGSLNRAYWRAYGVPDSRITLAPYAVDNAYFEDKSRAAREDPRAVRRRLGLPEDEPLFLFCAKLIQKKRPLDAIRALHQARASRRSHLVFVGDGELRAACEAEVSRLDLKAVVHFLGFRNQSELPEIYGACDALVLPSGVEPWGLVVNEAMACGLAIATSDRVGSAPDLVAPDNGAVFPAGDVAALAKILAGWADAPAGLAARKNRSRLRIAEWGIAQTAQGFVEGARAALEGRQRSTTASMF